MPILKKFGRSSADHKKRVLIPNARRKDDARVPTDIPGFLGTDPEALLGQWASAMDKIAKKPTGQDKPSSYQREFRTDLGAALWAVMTGQTGPYHGLDAATVAKLEKKWSRRVHPYPEGNHKSEKPASPKGRLYTLFVGEVGYGKADCGDVARKVLAHLTTGKLRGTGVAEREGLITSRAESMTKNTLPARKAPPQQSWLTSDIESYFRHGDLAMAIREAAENLEKDAKTRGGVNWRMAAGLIFAHYAKVFVDAGVTLSFKQAKENFPQKLALHCAIEDLYRSILKRHQKHAAQKSETGRKLSTLLPADKVELLRRIGHRHDNRSLSSLVRKGRILHYEALEQGALLYDRAEARFRWDMQTWLDDMHSMYWTSDGQTEIKRDEMFVRVWRAALSHANRTLADWLVPQGENMDITAGGRAALKTVLTALDDTHLDRQTRVLFGKADDKLETPDKQRAFVELVWTAYCRLRHSSFHFKPSRSFRAALMPDLKTDHTDALDIAHAILRKDAEGSEKRLLASLKAAHVEFFLDQGRLGEVWAALHPPGPRNPLPLPRFNRLVERVHNTTRASAIPEPVNARKMENPAIHCRYIVTKSIYETGFRAWVAQATSVQINAWIKTAETRAQEQNVKLNKQDQDLARMVGAVELREGQDLRDFLSQLTGLMATEQRIHAGYEPDKEQAKEQAAWINDLECDVLGLAFCDYLVVQRLKWLEDLFQRNPPGRAGKSDIDGIKLKEPGRYYDSEAGLYAVLHLIPVDQVGKLLHQLRRWCNGGKVTVSMRRLDRLLTLYLDMHDTKYEGGDMLADHPDLAKLYQCEEVMNRSLPELISAGEAGRVPLRALREMMRFGGLRVLLPVFQKNKINQAQIERLAHLERSGRTGAPLIESTQIKREDLHNNLCRKRHFAEPDQADLIKYMASTGFIVQHRNLANHVRLVNHVRLNQIMMEIFGRFADMAATYERDLYFVILATLQGAGILPEGAFNRPGLKKFGEGQVLTALRSMTDTGKAVLKDPLQQHFGLDACGSGRRRDIRNNFAHFDMLQKERSLHLTQAMNEARDLMSHDRKAKNAVVSAIKTLLEREQLVPGWAIADHKLTEAQFESKVITHFERAEMKEHLRDTRFLNMVALAFGGTSVLPTGDMADLAIEQIRALASVLTARR